LIAHDAVDACTERATNSGEFNVTWCQTTLEQLRKIINEELINNIINIQ